MAILRENSSSKTIMLEPEHSVGRHAACSLRLAHRFISARHAAIRWSGTRWEVRDHGSRNGTYLNGERLDAGKDYGLSEGAVIAFGKKEVAWTLVDPAEPRVMVVPLASGEPIIMSGELIAIPSASDPHATIFRDRDLGWVVELCAGRSFRVSNAQTFQVGDLNYKFCAPESNLLTSIADTPPEIIVASTLLDFRVSRDEEHVELTARLGGKEYSLDSQAQNYLLLTLARHRLTDIDLGIVGEDSGWVYQDDLTRGLRLSENQLNVSVFRVRKRFTGLPIVDPARIIERRPKTRQLRLGTAHIAVSRL